MDILTIAHKIEQDIKNLRLLCQDLEDLANSMALAIANYDKVLAKTILELKNQGNAVSIVEKLAKGKCFNEKLEMELAIALWKVKNSKIEACKSSLMGYQSINKHLENV